MMFVSSLYCNPSRVKDSIWPAQSEMTMPGQVFGLRDLGMQPSVCMFEGKVFNPNTQTNRKFPLAACYPCHEKMKKRAYEQRVTDIEHGSFTPLVFSTTVGMGKLAETFYRRLASLSQPRETNHTIRYWVD